MRFTLAWARTFPPSESQGWTVHFIERESRYWVDAQAGQKTNQLFEQGTTRAWRWAQSATFIRWFTDGERRYGQALWKLASVRLKADEVHPNYPDRKVWRQGLEVAMKIKGSQGRKRVEWVRVEHPFTAISPAHEVHANHNEAQNSALRRRASASSQTTKPVCQVRGGITTSFRCATSDPQLGTTTLGTEAQDDSSDGYGILQSPNFNL
jgi:hypothetical protein